MEHIVDLCSGRDTAFDHRIEHLCDYHIRHFVRLAYALYFMLNDRQHFQRDRIAKIPSGNDDFVAVWKERFKMRQPAFCLDLGIQTNIRPRLLQRFAHILQIFLAAHERLHHAVYPQFFHKLDIRQILFA